MRAGPNESLIVLVAFASLLGTAALFGCAHASQNSLAWVFAHEDQEIEPGFWGGPCLADGGCFVGQCTEWRADLADLNGQTCEIPCGDAGTCPGQTRCATQFADFGMAPRCLPEVFPYDVARLTADAGAE